MGTMETIGATAIGGILYSLFAGQPLTIIGTTGPLLAFIKVLYVTCKSKGIPFLPIYSWIGLWCSLILYLSAFFSTSNLIEYFTRFTDDIFSSLISVIFIVEAIRGLVQGFTNPVVTGVQACFSLIVAVTTYSVATRLSALRRTQFLTRNIRNLVADFAPTIGVLSGILVSIIASTRYSLSFPMLDVPTVLGTSSGRPWLVDIFSISNKLKLLCLLPALMASVLLFMDQNITVRLVMAKKNGLKKGSGIHLDMVNKKILNTIKYILK